MSWRSRIVGHDRVDPEELTGNPRNHRTHPQRQRDVVRDSIEEFGFVKSVLVNKTTGFIVDGHERVWQALNAKENDPSVLVDVEYVELSEAEEAAVLAVLDASTEMAVVDPMKLDELLREVNTESQAIADMLTELAEESGALDLGATAEIEDVEPQIDRASELAEEWGTAEGQLWIIKGKQEHRLLCGDSTKKEDVDRLMDGETADLCLTDPPYGVKRDKGFGGFGGFGPPIARRTYSDDWDAERPPQQAFDLILENAKGVIIFGGNFFADMLPPSSHWLVWDKNNSMPTFGDCELAWTNSSRTSVKEYEFTYNGLIGKEAERFHPTQKPVALIHEIAKDYTSEGDTISDHYCGSGTTMLAAEQLNRRCFGMEISPKYVAVILQRMKDAGCECRLEQ